MRVARVVVKGGLFCAAVVCKRYVCFFPAPIIIYCENISELWATRLQTSLNSLRVHHEQYRWHSVADLRAALALVLHRSVRHVV